MWNVALNAVTRSNHLRAVAPRAGYAWNDAADWCVIDEKFRCRKRFRVGPDSRVSARLERSIESSGFVVKDHSRRCVQVDSRRLTIAVTGRSYAN